MTGIIVFLMMLFAPMAAHADGSPPQGMNCTQTVAWATDSYVNVFARENIKLPMPRKDVERKFRKFLEGRPDSPCYQVGKSPKSAHRDKK